MCIKGKFFSDGAREMSKHQINKPKIYVKFEIALIEYWYDFILRYTYKTLGIPLRGLLRRFARAMYIHSDL